MTHHKLKRGALPLTLAAIAAGSALPSHQALAASSTKKYTGVVAQQHRWGPIQVTISVKSKKIAAVSVQNSPDTTRSTFIEANAIPQLKQEVLQAQSVNIDSVSGATDTSDGFITSLQSAMKKAVVAKTLPAKDLA